MVKTSCKIRGQEALSHVCGKKIVAVRLSPDDAKKINLLEDMKVADQNTKDTGRWHDYFWWVCIETDFLGVSIVEIEHHVGKKSASPGGNKNESTVH